MTVKEKLERALDHSAVDQMFVDDLVTDILNELRQVTPEMQRAAFDVKVEFHSTSGMSDIGQVSVEYPDEKAKGAATIFRAMLDV